MSTALVLVGVLAGVALGAYGRWAGWGFGLGWWGRTVPARVLAVRPLSGATLRGGREPTLRETSHRVAVDLDVLAEVPYRATAITWVAAGDSLSGRTLEARVSRTRPARVFVPRDAGDTPEPHGRY